MRILITNDDGIDALGIRLLTEWAKKLGEVTVVAPKIEQSGKSHAIELAEPIEVIDRSPLYGVEAYSVSSSPADCVRFGILGLKRKYDLVLSGINRGTNLGKDIVYSGTVGAIFEAAALGHKALALSTFPNSLDKAAEQLDEMYDAIVSESMLELHNIYNINLPEGSRGVKITRQGNSYFSDEFVCIGNDLYTQKGAYVPDEDFENTELDAVALSKGYISITPMQYGRTNEEIYMRLRKKDPRV